MFTKQYKTYKEMMFFNWNGVYMTDVSGSSYLVGAPYSYEGDIGACMATPRCGAQDATGVGIYFGRGTTPPTENNYRMEDVITTGLSFTTQGVKTTKPNAGVYVVENTFIVRNTASEEITISEIGCIGLAGKSSSKKYYCLYERQVLDTPVTIAPGESKLITYRITFNQSVS